MSYKDKINVLYVIWSLETGGAERIVVNLAKGLDKTRYNPMVCCLNWKGKLTHELEQAGITVFILNKKGKIDISIVGRLADIMRKYDIQIVHTHLWGANFWGRIAAKKAGVPVIIATEHNEDVWKTPLNFICDRWLSKWSDRIIAVSNKVKEFYVSKGIRPEKIEVIYNGIDADGLRVSGFVGLRVKEELGIKNDEIILAVIGRLVPQKGHRYLFEVLHQLDGKYNLKLLVVGEGPLKKELQLIAYSSQLTEKIVFTGLRNDVPRLFKAIDILVMPSIREGLPIVALEAMVCGVPIVATRVGGTPEVVIDGETGKLVEPKDCLALKEAITQVIENKSVTQRMVDNARKLVKEKFSLTNMLDETQRLYEELYYQKIKQ